MIKNLIIKDYEIHTSKSANEIISEINYRAKRQQKKKVLGVLESIKYNNFQISDDIIEIERNPFLYSSLQGIGKITFKLEHRINGTDIKCTIQPSIIFTLAALVIIIPFLLYVTIAFIIPFKGLHLTTLLFILLAWVVCIGATYLGFLFNRVNLESYSRTILYDLGLVIPDK